MKKKKMRVLMFIISIPSLIAIILFLPHFNHLALNIILLAVSIIGTLEVSNLIKLEKNILEKILPPIIGGSIPLFTYLELMDILPKGSLHLLVIFYIFLILIKSTFRYSPEKFSLILPSIGYNFLVLFYPSLFISYIIRFSFFENTTCVILTFMFIVYMNDTSAYLFGSLFGKKSRKIFLVSPNKSLVGFVAGITASIAFSILFFIICPQVFAYKFIFALIVGVVIGISSILGDLVESAIKRSADIKDSGSIIPGRGGIMDSIDSLFFSAPVFFYLLTWIHS